MSSAVAGPSIPPPIVSTSSTSKKHRKERKEAQAAAAADESIAAESDSSIHSTESHKERKRRRKDEKKAAKREAKRQASHDGDDSATEGASAPLTDGEVPTGDVQKWKGKGSAQSAFRTITSIVDLSIPPALSQYPRRAAKELIDTLLMRYVPQFGGVLICHTNISFLKRTATIDADGAFSVAPTRLTCLVWAPRIGMRLEGRITLSTPSHVSLLVHGIFNTSITSAHLPSVQEKGKMRKEDGYRWHEFPFETADVSMQDAAQDDTVGAVDGVADDFSEKSTGYWENAATSERLGGQDGTVVFTVVGLTIANHMLSIHGSLLRKPFSIPAPTYVPTTKQQRDAAAAAATAESTRRVRFKEELKTPEFTTYAEGERTDDEIYEDGEEEEEEEEEAAANVAGPARIETSDVKPDNSVTTNSKKRRSSVKDDSHSDGVHLDDERQSAEKPSKKKKSKKH